MSGYRTLLSLSIRNRLAGLRKENWRSGDGKLSAGKLAGGFFSLLAIVMVVGFVIFLEMVVYSALESLGMGQLLLSLALTVTIAGMVLMTFYYVLTTLFFARDTGFLASLPIRSCTLLGARLTEILLGETAFAALILLPAIIRCGVGMGMGAWYYFSGVLVTLTASMMPVAVVALLSALLVRLTGAGKHRDAVMMIYSVVMMVVMLYVELSFMTRIPDDAGMLYFIRLFTDSSVLLDQVSKAFPPSYWAMQGMMGHAGYLALYLGCAVGSIALAWAVLSPSYIGVCLKQTENGVASHRRKRAGTHETGTHSPLVALFLREWREVLRTPTYAFNSLSGIIMVPIMTVAMCAGMSSEMGGSMTVAFEMIRNAANELDPQYIFLGLTALLTFCCCINPAIDTAVSREGGRHMLSRMMPVSPRVQLQSKLMMGMSINAVACLTSTILFTVIFPKLAVVIWLAFLFTTVVTSLAMSCFSLTLDVLHPNFHWRSEQQAIKQNANVAWGVLLSMVLLALPVAAYFVPLLNTAWDQTLILCLTLGVCVVEAVAGYLLLMQVADKRYALLEDEAN